MPVTVVAVIILGIAAMEQVHAQSPTPEAYRIVPGDVLEIRVVGHDDWTQSVIVRPDGCISYRATGEIEVAGMTIGELTEIIYEAVGPGGRHLKSPEIVINVTSIQPATAHVLGAVARPGASELPRGFKAARQVLSAVGGALKEADLTRTVIHRNNGSREVVDLLAEMEGEAPDTYLSDGDQMVIPEVERFVGVIGVTGRGGEIALKPGKERISLPDLLLKVGGIPEGADEERALILSADGTIDDLDPSAVLRRERPSVELAAGDVLWILAEPEMEYFAVTGAVSAGGRFEFHEELTLTDALAMAGQLSEAADTRDVRVLHVDGQKTRVDIRPMLHGEDTDVGRLPIRAGDVVLVPVRDESYAVLGAVRQPGAFHWKEDLRLVDALAQAGGAREDEATMSELMLVRQVAPGEMPLVMTVDATKLLRGEPGTDNELVLPGDTIYVPPKGEAFRERMDTPLTVLGMGLSLMRIIGQF